MAQLIESYLPGVRENGLVTNEATTLGSTLAVTGAATFNGAVTFANAPTFSGGRLFNVINLTSGTTATVSQSASTILFNATTGILVTLPAPTVGTVYDFVVAQTPSSGTHGIKTNSGSVFIQGAVVVTPSGGTVATFTANGTSNVGLSLNGTTTGGIQGSQFRAVAITSTLWEITGTLPGSGALATPVF